MTEPRRTYLPTGIHAWFLPLYDPLVKLLGDDQARRPLLEQATSGRVIEARHGARRVILHGPSKTDRPSAHA